MPLLRSDQGRYDLRNGASVYASIVGGFSAIAVTAVVLVFTLKPPDKQAVETLGYCTGLLALAMFGSLLGAFGIAAISAEDDPTANLVPAVSFIAVPVVIAVTSTIAAFEALASIYTPGSADLFVGITGAGALFGIVFNSFTIADSSTSHPTIINGRAITDAELQAWFSRQWIKSREEAYKKTDLILAVCALPIVVVTVLRLSGAWSVSLGVVSANWLTGALIVVCMVGAYMGLNRTKHPRTGNDQKALKAWEAWSANAALAIVGCVLVVTLPLP